jgi:hypothetical protein
VVKESRAYTPEAVTVWASSTTADISASVTRTADRKHGEVPCPRCEGTGIEPDTDTGCLNPSCYEGKIWIGP